MSEVRVLLLRTAGTNCDRELGHAFLKAGAGVEIMHINALLKEPGVLERYQILGLPGGFSYGDDIASGKILANQLIHHLRKPLGQFVADGKMVLGVCNGFQVLVKSGLLPGPTVGIEGSDWHPTTLTYNSSGKFEDRWVKVRAVSKLCKWIPEGGCVLDLPVAHGEGRFVTRTPEVLAALEAGDQVAFQYVGADGEVASVYPELPNGSVKGIAGICDATGRVLGLMPHPERVVDAVNHPLATRGGGKADGLGLFETAVGWGRERMAVAG
ncbi:MAG: phosphoribosylformylglycinamidine synthase I [Phycisphaerae bacterium]